MKNILFFVLTIFVLTVPAKALTVSASYPPVYSLVLAVMKDVQSPTLLNQVAMSSPHTSVPSKKEQRRLSNADVVFWVGPELEAYMPDALKAYGKKDVLSVPLMEQVEGLKILPSFRTGNGQDAHIWMTPDNVILLVDKIVEVLSQKDLKHASKYAKNAEKFKEVVQQLEKYKIPEGTKTSVVVSLHDGYQYVFDYMGLKNAVAFHYDDEDFKVSNTITNLDQELKELKTMCLIVSPALSEKQINALMGKNQYKLISYEPMGWYQEMNSGHYFVTMSRLMIAISQCVQSQK